MRSSLLPFALPMLSALGMLTVIAAPARAQEDGVSKRRLDTALTVLREHQDGAGKSCLDAMTRVHQTEDQVAGLGQQDSNTNHPDNGADVARDVLESDYETAEEVCRPDAERVCASLPGDKACARLNGGPNDPPPGR